MTQTARTTFVLGGLVLLAGLALVLLGSRPLPERTFKGSVKDLLPTAAEVPSWTVEYLPIADTPEMKAKVAEALNYDDAVYAIYTHGATRISVYIAYWIPGKMPYRLVAGHTPDVCWVGNGWKPVEANTWKPEAGDLKRASGPLAMVLTRIAPLMQASNTTHALFENSPAQLPPAEYRVMELNGNVERVVFWHLLDGRPMSYGTKGLPPWYAVFSDLLARSLNQRPEQFFIRISSNKSVTAKHSMEVYRQLMTRRPIKG